MGNRVKIESLLRVLNLLCGKEFAIFANLSVDLLPQKGVRMCHFAGGVGGVCIRCKQGLDLLLIAAELSNYGSQWRVSLIPTVANRTTAPF